MRRPGITLLEVLTAIFITGIGLLSLLTLFPLGALKMAEAIRDDRAALCGANGLAIANAVNLRNDPLVQAAMLGQANGIVVSPDGPGLPVLVDPVGALAYAGYTDPITLAPWWQWVAGAPNTIQQGTPRVVGQWLLPIPSQTQATLSWCTLPDDINFVSDGTYQGQAQDLPVYAGGLPNVQRNLNFSYAWLCRMPRAGAPSVVNASVLVFVGRSLDFVGTQEKAYTAVFNAQANTVALYSPAGTDLPALRRGQWILDASLATMPITGTNPLQYNLVSARGFFYRIVSVSDPTVDANNNTYVSVEVQTPLRGWITPDPAFPIFPQIPGFQASPYPVQGQLGSVVIFDNLIEVFEDGTF